MFIHVSFFPFFAAHSSFVPTFAIDADLINKLQKLRQRLRDAEFQSSARSQELISLQAQLAKIIATQPRTNLKTINSSKRFVEPLASSSTLNLPSIYHLMPHLMDNPDSLMPSLQVSKDRVGGK